MASGAAVDEEDWVAAVVTGTSWRADGTVEGRLAGFSAGDKRRRPHPSPGLSASP